jgi:hypothetical protein
MESLELLLSLCPYNVCVIHVSAPVYQLLNCQALKGHLDVMDIAAGRHRYHVSKHAIKEVHKPVKKRSPWTDK